MQCLGVRLAGDHIGDVSERGEPIIGDTTMLLLNAHHEAIDFILPATKKEHLWHRLFDTSTDGTEDFVCSGESVHCLEGRSVALFVTRVPEDVDLPVNTTQVEHLRRKKRRPMSAVPSGASVAK